MELTFEKRIAIGSNIEEVVARFLKRHGLSVLRIAEIVKTGIDSCNDELLQNAWKSDAMKNNNAMVMLRYMPDLAILSYNGKSFQDAIFIDVKAMFTPVYLNTFPAALERVHGRPFAVENIGNVEREAFESYKSYQRAGAKVAILAACSYHPELILCEFVENILELHKDTENRNQKSTGSTTPRINIDLSSMRSLGKFLKDTFDFSTNSADDVILHQYVRKQLGFVACPSSLLNSSNSKDQVKSVLKHLTNATGYDLKLQTV